jgi:HlyD family secretion protein
MAINPKTPEDQNSLNERLRSLKIDRGPAAVPATQNRLPKLLLLCLAVLVALVAMGYFYFFSAPKTISAAEIKLESSTGSHGDTVLSASGYVVAHHKIDVGAKVMGRVDWIGVEKGDTVQRGQVLVRLEDSDFRAQSNQARANLAAAQARLDQLRSGSRPQEKLKDRAGVLQAQATLTNAEADYDRNEKLYRAGVSSKADLDRALAQRDTARALVEAARQSSSMTDVGPRPEEIRAAEAQVSQMKAALDYAETQLAATEIKAPVSGTVLQRIVERGEMVNPSSFGGDSGARTSVVALADLSDLQIELDISQTDFARLQMSQRAEIIPEAFPNLKYTGFIAEIAPEANRAKATVQVKVKVENPDAQLRPEMNARVNFLGKAASTTQSVPRVLVPKAAVVRKDGSDFVFVIKGNKVEQRSVRLGDESGAFYYLFEGLNGGESVATAGVDKLRDGDRVKISDR